MADDEIAKKDISDILNLINRKFEIIDAVWSDSKYFETKFRTQIPRDNEDYNKLCDDWVDLFSKNTNTVWVKKTSNTGPKIKFRKQYQCWTGNGKVVQKELLFDPRRCKGVVDIKVLTDNPLTRRKNKHIRKGLNIVIKINFKHLHPVDITRNFSFFVHNCEPLREVPKTVITPNEKLPQLIEEMIQKGHITSQKAAKRAEAKLKELQRHEDPITNNSVSQESAIQLQQNQQADSATTLHILQASPLDNIDSIKLELRPSQYTQVMVNAPHLDNVISDQYLTCQPIMFDMGPMVPISSQSTFIHVEQLAPSISSQPSVVTQAEQYL